MKQIYLAEEGIDHIDRCLGADQHQADFEVPQRHCGGPDRHHPQQV
jgi:hypothetical protein